MRRIVDRLPVGNVYVNRNMIGAVVGTQPFGGSGLSGTGPKAGGPDYLRRFALEQVGLDQHGGRGRQCLADRNRRLVKPVTAGPARLIHFRRLDKRRRELRLATS